MEVPELSDTAWIAITIIVAVVASTITAIILLLRNKPKAYIRIPTEWGDFVFSPGDAERLLTEQIKSLPKSEIDALLEFNKKDGKPQIDALNALDQKVLDALVHRNLVQDPEANELAYKKENLQLAYSGWQILEGVAKKRPIEIEAEWPEPKWTAVPPQAKTKREPRQ